MFRWLANQFRRRRLRKQRQLFSFFDGTRQRSVDPMRVWLQLDTHSEYSWDLGDAVDAGDSEATEIVVRAACDVFGIQRWDSLSGSGLTDGECLLILYGYLEFIETEKKNTNAGPTSLPPTESNRSSSKGAQPATTA